MKNFKIKLRLDIIHPQDIKSLVPIYSLYYKNKLIFQQSDINLIFLAEQNFLKNKKYINNIDNTVGKIKI